MTCGWDTVCGGKNVRALRGKLMKPSQPPAVLNSVLIPRRSRRSPLRVRRGKRTVVVRGAGREAYEAVGDGPPAGSL
ncbi:MAG: hypothetical protein LBD24_09750 [Spirochaetaceae bacterium]|nr:hypothetical protein [Spirochaetaceae bacterium]